MSYRQIGQTSVLVGAGEILGLEELIDNALEALNAAEVSLRGGYERDHIRADMCKDAHTGLEKYIEENII